MASVSPSAMSAAGRPRLLAGKRVCLFCDFNFEDMELMYPKMRLEEEGATVLVVGAHEKGMKYTGKHGECESLPRVPSSARFSRHRTHNSPFLAGYPIKSDESAETVDASTFDALVIPGGFAPDYMRRSAKMLEICVAMAEAGKPVASICHGPWMLCRSRHRLASIPALLSDLAAAEHPDHTRRAARVVAVRDERTAARSPRESRPPASPPSRTISSTPALSTSTCRWWSPDRSSHRGCRAT